DHPLAARALVRGIFENEASFVEQSQRLARLLYDRSEHPKIKGGELNVVVFRYAILEGKPLDAVGIFKTETKDAFLKMSDFTTRYQIKHEMGIGVNSLDKGCIIFNTEREDGFRVFLSDKVSKPSGDAQYWAHEFLELQPLSDAFHNTKNFLSLTKSFVTDQLSDEEDVSGADRVDLLNRSMDFFKSRDTFVKKDFEEEVLQKPNIIKSFRSYNNDVFVDNEEAAIYDRFDISSQAVKRQQSNFKSVLKLDKNFHVYIHGDRSMIEHGVEPNGRKFYKLYYESEQ
ncbi:MAG TPA: nucleoid-associated protein, partial [Chitinophagales bacterium]|nr:nucleoid-associated protein [Chitinophagales bacterium]